MPKKDSLGQRRPEPPPYKDGDYKTAYNNVSEFRTLTLDEGAFLYLWDFAFRQWKTLANRTYLSEELVSVITRMEEAFEAAAPDYVPEISETKTGKREGKKNRCPDCGTKNPKKVRKNGVPKWKCLDCGRKWDRDVPAEAPEKPVEAPAAKSEGSDASERPRKRQKPPKKKQKKAS